MVSSSSREAKIIPSYRGWLRFRGIPLHAWNLNTFEQIGEASGGLFAIDFNILQKFDLTEAKLKVKDNYCGCIPTEIEIILENQIFKVYTVPPPKRKLFAGKHPSIHGTFSKDVVASFDTTDPNAESFLFHDGATKAS